MEGSPWLVVVEGMILVLSLFRIFVVVVVLAVNITSLRRCMSSKAGKCQCLHLYVSDSVKICNIIYIASWTPFLVYSLLNGRWLLIEEQLFCLIQNYMTNAILMVLLAMAALLAYSRGASSGKTESVTAAVLTLTAWMLPQLSYFLILTTSEQEETNPQPSTMDFLDNLHPAGSLGIKYKIGFTICGQVLCRMVMTQYILQYVVVVLPVCLILAMIFIRFLFNVNSGTYSELTEEGTISRVEDPCTCWHAKGSGELATILAAIVVWMALIRPCILFFWSADSLFIDLGSHLMLTVSAVFAPIVPRLPATARHVDIYRIDLVDGSKNSYSDDNTI